MGGVDGGDSSVDAIWASLKAKTAPSQHAARAKALIRGASDRGSASPSSSNRANNSASAGSKSPKPSKRARDLPVAPSRTRGSACASSSSSSSSTAPADADDAALAESRAPTTRAFETADELGAAIARDLNALADAQGSAAGRLRALRAIRRVIDTASPKLLADAAASILAKPLLRRFEDVSEQCREAAVDALAALVARGGEDVTLDLLPYLIPVLRDRLGPLATDGKDPSEPAEEIRASAHALLTSATRDAGTGIAAYASDVAEVLEFTCEDKHVDVVVQACACLEQLVTHLGRRLQPIAKKLAWTFTPNLTHKRARVRVETLKALRVLMHCGAHETILDLVAFKHPNLVPIKAFYGDDQKVNYFGKLATDGAVHVRREFIRTVGDWMTTLTERTDHESRLLPYVMSALTDEASVVQEDAMELMDKLGAQYEREHENDLKSTMAYMPEHFGGEAAYGAGDDALVLPPPFTTRPRLGSRILVKNNFSAVVNPVIGEMSSWQTELRGKAATLLRTMMVYLEENATQHCAQLCASFVVASADDNVSENVRDCGKLLGRFVAPKEWLSVLVEKLGATNDTATRTGAARVLAACLAGASADAMAATDDATGTPLVSVVLDALSDPELVGSADTSLRAAVCGVVETCAAEKSGTWSDRVAALVGVAIRLGGGEGVERTPLASSAAAVAARGAIDVDDAGDKAAAAMRRALSALASAGGHADASALVASARGALLTPLRSLPPKGWKPADAAVLAAAAEAPGTPSPEETSALVQLSALVAERAAGADARERLLSFPFIARSSTSAALSDGDVALLLGAALRAAAADACVPGGIARDALAASLAALRPGACASSAAAAAARDASVALSDAMSRVDAPAPVRRDAIEVTRALVERHDETCALAIETVVRVVTALRARLDDSADDVRRAAAAALASTASSSSAFATYHACLATLQPHLLSDDAFKNDARGVLLAGMKSHAVATSAAVDRSRVRATEHADVLSGVGGGTWTESDVEGFDDAMATFRAAEAAAAEARKAEQRSEEEIAADGATKRLAAVGIDVDAPVERAAAAATREEDAGDDDEPFDLD